MTITRQFLEPHVEQVIGRWISARSPLVSQLDQIERAAVVAGQAERIGQTFGPDR